MRVDPVHPRYPDGMIIMIGDLVQYVSRGNGDVCEGIVTGIRLRAKITSDEAVEPGEMSVLMPYDDAGAEMAVPVRNVMACLEPAGSTA